MPAQQQALNVGSNFMMNSPKYNLKRFCFLKGIDITRERDVQHGKQFTLSALGDVVHLTLFPRTNFVQGVESKLKTIIKAWADKSEPYRGGLRLDLPSGWREWNEEANWIEDFHKKHGLPKEDELNHRYLIRREVLFHDYMFRNATLDGVSFEKFEKLIRAWFNRNCFMNLDVERIIISLKNSVERGGYWDLTHDNVPFSVAADFIAEELANNCPNKYVCVGKSCHCPQTETDEADCVLDIVDALFPYYSKQVLSFTKGNLDRLMKRDYDLKWRDISPSTPIEVIMSDKLIDAGILSVPQYQAWDDQHRYNIDFVVKTPQGMNIAIECDGLQFHAKPSAYIHDRKRDRYLQDKGFYVMRFSSVEIYNEIENVITEIDKSYWKIQKRQLDIRKPYRISYFGYSNEE